MVVVPGAESRVARVVFSLGAVLAAFSHLFVPSLVLAAIDPVSNTGIGVDGPTAYAVRLGTAPWTIPALLIFDVCFASLLLFASRRRPVLAYAPVVVFAAITLLFPLLAYPWGH